MIALRYKGEHIKRYIVDYFTCNDSNLTVDMHNGGVRTSRTAGALSESWTVHLVETGDSTETGARIKRIAPHLGDETFMLTYGDGVSDVDLSRLVEFHCSHGRLATTVVHPPARFGKVELEGDAVARFVEKPHSPESMVRRWVRGGSTAVSSSSSLGSSTTSTTITSRSGNSLPSSGSPRTAS